MKFFIGNWKMFGILSSKKIIEIIGANSESPGVENQIAPNTPKIM